MSRAVLLAFLLAGCAYLKKTQPDDVCIKPCQIALEGQVDDWRLDGTTCSCYRMATGDEPEAFLQTPVK